MSIEKLLTITALLRDPQYGCSWDLKQDFQSITAHTIEEVYEVIDCIENEDFKNLPNELGDLLFQIVLYAQMGQEAGKFDFNNVLEEICEKLLTRHPHVFPEATIESFGKENALTPEQVELKWEEIKQQERLSKGEKSSSSALDNIPNAFPALLKAKKLQKKAANVGFDWDDVKGVLAKVKEEITELEDAIEEAEESHIKEEFGDVLFSLINLARHLKLDSESSLRSCNEKFEERFRLMEAEIFANKLSINSLSLEKLESYWQKAKLELKGRE